ncbi:hypothetical protein [Dictyobacter aurantiacus]|uniref:Uncharacterized protein n=1 Tax=Dictyobacter aurantiacus TaxID=1936993 RepID=A0A401ZMW6_9CHLR|nr:hypothetical protein [Dictyobacter aurantiacus]GCE08208.1 hypothetical protein KDAU_55370 [Dictyobacter aurantiacus]
MMPQQEANDEQQEQAGVAYGKYEGESASAYAYQQYQRSPREEPAGKLYTPAPDNKNMLRLVAFGMALLALIVLAVLCLVVVGNAGAGWISFCAACLTIFILAVVVIDKIK